MIDPLTLAAAMGAGFQRGRSCNTDQTLRNYPALTDLARFARYASDLYVAGHAATRSKCTPDITPDTYTLTVAYGFGQWYAERFITCPDWFELRNTLRGLALSYFESQAQLSTSLPQILGHVEAH